MVKGTRLEIERPPIKWSVGSNPTPSAILRCGDFRQRPTTGPGSGHATRDRFSIRATGRLPPTTRRRTRPPGGSGRSRTVRDVTRQTPRFSADFPKSERPLVPPKPLDEGGSVRQSRREALCSPGTNRPKRFPNATRLAPRPPDPLRFLPPDSDPQKSGLNRSSCASSSNPQYLRSARHTWLGVRRL